MKTRTIETTWKKPETVRQWLAIPVAVAATPFAFILVTLLAWAAIIANEDASFSFETDVKGEK